MLRAASHFLLRKSRLSAFIILLLLAVGGWTFLYVSLNRRLARFNDDFKKQGFPVSIEDLNRPAIPDDQNPTLLIQKAGAWIEQYDKTNAVEYGSAEFPPYEEKLKKLADAESALAQAFELADRAAKLPPGYFNFHYSSPTKDLPFARVTQPKLILDALYASAVYNLYQGNASLAIHRLDCLLKLTRSFNNEYALIYQLYTEVVLGRSTKLAHFLLANLKPDDLQQNRQTLESWIPFLLDESPRQKGYIQAFAFNRIMMSNHFDNEGDPFCVTKPLYLGGKLLLNQRTREFLDNLQSPWKPGLKQSRFPIEKEDARYYATAQYMQDFTERSDQLVSCKADSRAAAVTLAARLYYADHNQQYPPSLADLVPQYLPAVPIDPFTSKPPVYQIKKNPQGVEQAILNFNPRELHYKIDFTLLLPTIEKAPVKPSATTRRSRG